MMTTVVSPRRRVTASGGSRLDVSAVRPADVLVVPGFEVRPAFDVRTVLARLEPEAATIRARASTGTAVVPVCGGAFPLAEAGLLRRRGATTS
ncbi:hypothetical protein [Streptomyces sp. NPDC058613]|uniref:hypothetical protein n=1 Tax=Streptomyces sp. NPDC058613 TaxID=3346556 RepID=UPI00364F75B3